MLPDILSDSDESVIRSGLRQLRAWVSKAKRFPMMKNLWLDKIPLEEQRKKLLAFLGSEKAEMRYRDLTFGRISPVGRGTEGMLRSILMAQISQEEGFRLGKHRQDIIAVKPKRR